MRSPKQMENARFFFLQKMVERNLLVSYCLSGMHKNSDAFHTMRQNSKKGIDKSLFRVYSRVVKWIHYHRLDIKILKRRCRDSRNSKVPGRSFQNEKGL